PSGSAALDRSTCPRRRRWSYPRNRIPHLRPHRRAAGRVTVRRLVFRVCRTTAPQGRRSSPVGTPPPTWCTTSRCTATASRSLASACLSLILWRAAEEVPRDDGELLAVAGLIGTGEPAQLYYRASDITSFGGAVTVRVERGHPGPEPAALHRQRSPEPHEHRDGETQDPPLRGIVRHLQRHPSTHAVEADPRPVVQSDALAEPQILPCHPLQPSAVHHRLIDLEDRLRASGVHAEFAPHDVHGHGGFGEVGERRGEDVAVEHRRRREQTRD